MLQTCIAISANKCTTKPLRQYEMAACRATRNRCLSKIALHALYQSLRSAHCVISSTGRCFHIYQNHFYDKSPWKWTHCVGVPRSRQRKDFQFSIALNLISKSFSKIIWMLYTSRNAIMKPHSRYYFSPTPFAISSIQFNQFPDAKNVPTTIIIGRNKSIGRLRC